MINMVSITVEVDTSALTEKLSADKLEQAKEQGMNYATQEMVRVLMQNSPVDHGLLKSWFIDTFSSEEASIKSPAEYARYVNDGTGPYTITPKGQATYYAGQKLTSGSALWWEGLDHPVKVVHHPGIKGQHFVEDSINDVSGRLDGYFLRAISEVLG
jgi:hypothetical protein